MLHETKALRRALRDSVLGRLSPGEGLGLRRRYRPATRRCIRLALPLRRGSEDIKKTSGVATSGVATTAESYS